MITVTIRHLYRCQKVNSWKRTILPGGRQVLADAPTLQLAPIKAGNRRCAFDANILRTTSHSKSGE